MVTLSLYYFNLESIFASTIQITNQNIYYHIEGNNSKINRQPQLYYKQPILNQTTLYNPSLHKFLFKYLTPLQYPIRNPLTQQQQQIMQLIRSIAVGSTLLLRSHKSKLFVAYMFAHSKPNTPNYRSYNRQQQSTSRPNLPRKLDPSYWQQLLPTVQPQAGKIVKMLLNPSSSKKQIARQLQQYLQFRNTTFTLNVRSDLGCLAVLVAINQANYSGNLQEYENRIVDFVTLADVTYNPFDNVMLKYLLFAIHKRMGMNLQKNIRQYYRLKLVEIAIDNFERIDNKDLIQLISIIEDSLQKDKMNFITKWRFYPLLQAIQGRITALMKDYANTKDHDALRSIQSIITPPFLYKYLHLTYFYDFLTPEDASIFYDFLTKRDQQKKDDHHFVSGFLNALCYIPYVQVSNPKDPQGKPITVRNKLLNYFEGRYNQSNFYRKAWNDFHIQSKKYTLQRFFQDEFHATFKYLPFVNVADKYLILNKKDLIKPKIAEFVWRLFKENQKLILEKYILNDIIKNLYPQKISLPKSAIPSTYINKYHGMAPDNEANLKIWQALDQLGYEYKKEQSISQRQVDLVVDENIIIEVDGEGHYMYLTNQLAPDTSFRNLHLLLSGYKLVIISMYEYNNNRSTEQLKQLIKEKMELIQQQEVVYVC